MWDFLDSNASYQSSVFWSRAIFLDIYFVILKLSRMKFYSTVLFKILKSCAQIKSRNLLYLWSFICLEHLFVVWLICLGIVFSGFCCVCFFMCLSFLWFLVDYFVWVLIVEGVNVTFIILFYFCVGFDVSWFWLVVNCDWHLWTTVGWYINSILLKCNLWS